MAVKKADVAALTGAPPPEPAPVEPKPEAPAPDLEPAADEAPVEGLPAADEAPVEGLPAADEAPFMSEGVRQDIEMHGSAVDPITGKKLTRDDLPRRR